MTSPDADLWVFGYGSLMWRPGFDYVERHLAHLHGYHRSLCIFSHVHRGTPEMPGLVLGLDRGGRCRGIAFRVPHGAAEPTLAYLRAREQATSVYLERRVRVHLAAGATGEAGATVTAVTYVADRGHPQYAGRLATDDLVRFVNQGIGISGANPDYVHATHRQLMEIGVSDPVLAGIATRLSQTSAEKAAAPTSTSS